MHMCVGPNLPALVASAPSFKSCWKKVAKKNMNYICQFIMDSFDEHMETLKTTLCQR